MTKEKPFKGGWGKTRSVHDEVKRKITGGLLWPQKQCEERCKKKESKGRCCVC